MSVHIPMIKRGYSDEEEKTIRRQFFAMKWSPERILQEWSKRRLTKSGLRRIVGGPLYRQELAVENSAAART